MINAKIIALHNNKELCVQCESLSSLIIGLASIAKSVMDGNSVILPDTLIEDRSFETIPCRNVDYVCSIDVKNGRMVCDVCHGDTCYSVDLFSAYLAGETQIDDFVFLMETPDSSLVPSQIVQKRKLKKKISILKRKRFAKIEHGKIVRLDGGKRSKYALATKTAHKSDNDKVLEVDLEERLIRLEDRIARLEKELKDKK